jgi:hypothetical protein
MTAEIIHIALCSHASDNIIINQIGIVTVY